MVVAKSRSVRAAKRAKQARAKTSQSGRSVARPRKTVAVPASARSVASRLKTTAAQASVQHAARRLNRASPSRRSQRAAMPSVSRMHLQQANARAVKRREAMPRSVRLQRTVPMPKASARSHPVTAPIRPRPMLPTGQSRTMQSRPSLKRHRPIVQSQTRPIRIRLVRSAKRQAMNSRLSVRARRAIAAR